MPTPPSDKARIKAEETAYDSLGRTIRRLQGQAHEILINWFGDNISSADGKVKMNAGNLAKVGGVFNVLQGFGKTLKRIVLGEVMDSAGAIIDANQSYFETFAEPVDIQVEARYQALLRMGYNTKNGLILPGSYLDSLFKNGDVSQRVAQLMNQAIAGGMSLKDFRLLFRNVFVGQAGAGMLERYYKTATFDLFQRIDRAAHLVYADRLGLDNAVYSGTLIQTSRPFCIERVAKVYSRKEIAAWANLKFDGKPLIYDPFQDCGGHNCRHHLSFVSEGIAAFLRKKQE